MRLLILLTFVAAICGCGKKSDGPPHAPAPTEGARRDNDGSGRNAYYCHEVPSCKSHCKRDFNYQTDQEIMDYYDSIGMFNSPEMFAALSANQNTYQFFLACIDMPAEDVLR